MLRKLLLVLGLSTLAAAVAVAAPVRHAKTKHRVGHSTHSHPIQKHPVERHPVDKHPVAHRVPSHPKGVHATERHPSAHPSSKRVKKHPVVYRRRLRRGGATRYRGAHLERASLRRRVVMFASPLKGSLESLTRQNQMAESEGLERILDDDDLNNRIEEKLLVPVPASSGLEVNPALPENRRYCRPWTADFLSDLAQEHATMFHRPLIVTSAVRTVAYQERLMRINGNAAAAEGDLASPHLTGATIDIGKKGMTRAELNWMRAWLLRLQTAGEIDVEEEFRQACFHITVYKTYDAPPVEPTAPKPDGETAAAGEVTAGGI